MPDKKFERMFAKGNNFIKIIRLFLSRKTLEEDLDQCKSAHLSAKITFDTQEKKFQEQLIVKDKQLLSIATNVCLIFSFLSSNIEI